MKTDAADVAYVSSVVPPSVATSSLIVADPLSVPLRDFSRRLRRFTYRGVAQLGGRLAQTCGLFCHPSLP